MSGTFRSVNRRQALRGAAARVGALALPATSTRALAAPKTIKGRPLSALSVLASDLDHPEGVCWAPDGRVYATGEAGQVYRIDPADGSVAHIASTGGFGLGIASDANSNLYVCDMGVKAAARILAPNGSASTRLVFPLSPPARRPSEVDPTAPSTSERRSAIYEHA